MGATMKICKTIFIPVFSGVEGKNIIRSLIYTKLRGCENLRVVFVFKNPELAKHYKKELGNSGVVLELVPKLKTSIAERLFSVLKMYLLRTETIDLHRLTNLKENGNRVRYLLSLGINRLFARKCFRRIVRFLDLSFNRPNVFSELFNKYNPDLIFLADLFSDLECIFLKEARHRGVGSVGLINTWDRTTSRWMLRVLPDWFIVFNNIMKNELVTYADMAADKIFVSGTVQHDFLVNNKPSSKRVFYSSLNISLDSRIILYCPIGSGFDKMRTELDRGVIRLINDWITGNVFGTNKIILLVRFHPNDFIDINSWPRLNNVRYDVPGIKFNNQSSDVARPRTRGQNWDMDLGSLQHLKDSLFYSELVVCYYTSLSIDAAVLDKPVININFDIKNGKIVEGNHRYYSSTHYQNAIKTEGIKLVSKESELTDSIINYLCRPGEGRLARSKLVAQQCFRLDGHSGERIASFIIDKIGLN